MIVVCQTLAGSWSGYFVGEVFVALRCKISENKCQEAPFMLCTIKVLLCFKADGIKQKPKLYSIKVPIYRLWDWYGELDNTLKSWQK